MHALITQEAVRENNQTKNIRSLLLFEENIRLLPTNSVFCYCHRLFTFNSASNSLTEPY